MRKIENYNLPEHTNRLYREEASSSIGLTHDVAKKLNEIIDAYNELSKLDLEWKQTQEGTIRKAILYMKDNLLNSLNDLMVMMRDSGFIDDRISYHCKVINDRLENLLGKVKEGSTTGDAELIDARTDYTGILWDNVGQHIRAFFEMMGVSGLITREQTTSTYNNLNYKDNLKTGDRVYVEPLKVNCDDSKIKYITVFGMYGDYAEDGTDVLAYILPEHVRPIILTLEREYAGIRITYNFTEELNTIAYGIVKKLTNDLASITYENKIRSIDTRRTEDLFNHFKMEYGAHQGYRAIAPANTLAAYEEAGRAGFEWAWIAGCRQSADGTWYVMHDADVSTTTNGTGAIKEMTDAQIGALVINKGNNLGNYADEELKVPTVDEVVNVCKKHGMKVCYRLQSLYTNATGVEHFRSFIEMVKKQGNENSIFSGNLKQILMLKKMTDNWHGQVYVDTENTQDVIDMIDSYVANGLTNMSILATYAATTKETVEYCHKHGYRYCVSDIPALEDKNVIIANLKAMNVDICQTGHIFDEHNLKQLWKKVNEVI